MKQKTMKAQMEQKIFEGSKAVGIQFFQVAPHEIVIRVRDKVHKSFTAQCSENNNLKDLDESGGASSS